MQKLDFFFLILVHLLKLPDFAHFGGLDGRFCPMKHHVNRDRLQNSGTIGKLYDDWTGVEIL
jgi:hypothetical protein